MRLYGDALKPCTCSVATVTKYQKRISGPARAYHRIFKLARTIADLAVEGLVMGAGRDYQPSLGYGVMGAVIQSICSEIVSSL